MKPERIPKEKIEKFIKIAKEKGFSDEQIKQFLREKEIKRNRMKKRRHIVLITIIIIILAFIIMTLTINNYRTDSTGKQMMLQIVQKEKEFISKVAILNETNNSSIFEDNFKKYLLCISNISTIAIYKEIKTFEEAKKCNISLEILKKILL